MLPKFNNINKYIMLILLVISSSAASSQDLNIVYPAQGQQNMPIESYVEIEAPQGYEFVQQYLVTQPTRKETYWNGTEYVKTPIVFFETKYYDGSEESLRIACSRGSFAFVENISTTKIKIFANKTFSKGKSYSIFFKDLRLKKISTNSIEVVDQVLVDCFTTVLPLPDVTNSSLRSGAINALDDISVDFNLDMQTYFSSSNPFITLVYKDYNGNQIEFPVDYNLINEGKTIVMSPQSPLDLQTLYSVDVALSQVIGTTQNDISLPITLIQSAWVNISAKDMKGKDLDIEFFPNGRQTQYVVGPSTPLKLKVPEYRGNMVFSHWSCPNLSKIDGSKNRDLTLSMDVTELKDIDISPVYKEMETDLIQINLPRVEGVVVIEGFESDKGNGCYTIPNTLPITISTAPKAGYEFSHWQSNIKKFNGSTDNVLHFTPVEIAQMKEDLDELSKWDIGPIFTAKDPYCESYTVNVKVESEDGRPLNDKIVDIIDVYVQGKRVPLDGDELEVQGKLENLDLINDKFRTRYEIHNDLYEVFYIKENHQTTCNNLAGGYREWIRQFETYPVDASAWKDTYSPAAKQKIKGFFEYAIPDNKPCSSYLTLQVRKKQHFILVEESMLEPAYENLPDEYLV